MNKILLLEDMEDRVVAFRAAITKLYDVELILWRDANTMIRDLSEHLPTASIISLDHDLLPAKGSASDPGTGLDVCEALARRKPTCPILLHTANYMKVWPMMNELAFADWDIHWTPPVRMDESWIESIWLPQIKRLLKRNPRG